MNWEEAHILDMEFNNVVCSACKKNRQIVRMHSKVECNFKNGGYVLVMRCPACGRTVIMDREENLPDAKRLRNRVGGILINDTAYVGTLPRQFCIKERIL